MSLAKTSHWPEGMEADEEDWGPEVKELEKLEEELKNENEEIHTRGLEEESETIRQEGKRRKVTSKIVTKKRKLEPLVDWEEREDDIDLGGLRNWFQPSQVEEKEHHDETDKTIPASR